MPSRTTTADGWTCSTFDRGRDRLEWRYEGDLVHLRHAGGTDAATLTLPLAQWRSFIAGVTVGQAGTAAY